MAERLRILFVDDEVRVRDGLQRLLRPLRDRWEVLTAGDAQQALALLARQEMDVVISDMRMPGMDGAALLRGVQQLRPATVRIMLSGQAEGERDLRLIGPVQQFLDKPCDLTALRSAIDLALALRDLVAVQVVEQRLAGHPFTIGDETGFAAVTIAGSSVQGSPTSIPVDVVERGRATGRWLADTSGSSSSRPSDQADEAVVAAGILGEHLLHRCPPATASGLDATWMRRHAQQVGRLACDIATAEGASSEVCIGACIAGLLHDTGSLLLAHDEPVAHGDVLAEVAGAGSLEAAERRRFALSHAQLGAALSMRWGFPLLVCEAVAFHHFPAAGISAGFTPLTAVHAAEGVLAALGHGGAPAYSTGLAEPYLASRGLGARIAAWRQLGERVLTLSTPGG
jgi:CheY-like chemotaxis protein